MRTTKILQCLIALVLVVLFIAPLSLVAQTVSDIKLKASKYGPLASLKGRSKYLLPALRDEKGQALNPTKIRSYGGKYYLLSSDAKPDKQGTIAFLKAELRAYGPVRHRRHRRHSRRSIHRRYRSANRTFAKKSAVIVKKSEAASTTSSSSNTVLTAGPTPTPIAQPTPSGQASPTASTAGLSGSAKTETPAVNWTRLILGAGFIALLSLLVWLISLAVRRITWTPMVPLRRFRTYTIIWWRTFNDRWRNRNRVPTIQGQEEVVEETDRPGLEDRLNGM